MWTHIESSQDEDEYVCRLIPRVIFALLQDHSTLPQRSAAAPRAPPASCRLQKTTAVGSCLRKTTAVGSLFDTPTCTMI